MKKVNRGPRLSAAEYLREVNHRAAEYRRAAMEGWVSRRKAMPPIVVHPLETHASAEARWQEYMDGDEKA
jgi:hypothetical protein